MYCNIINAIVVLLYCLNKFNMVEVAVMFVLIGFGVLLSLIILWLLMLLDEKKSKIGDLENKLDRVDSDLAYNSLLRTILKVKDERIVLMQRKIERLEGSGGNNGSTTLTSLTPKDVKLIKQYLHPDKHNGKSSEIYTKVVGLLSKEG